MSAKQSWTAWLPLGLYSALVIQSAVMPPDAFRFLARFNDKLIHGVEYFLLFWFAFRAFTNSQAQSFRLRAPQHSFYYCLAMGALTEGLQYFTPNRSASGEDFAADALGAGFGYLILKWRLARPRRTHP